MVTCRQSLVLRGALWLFGEDCCVVCNQRGTLDTQRPSSSVYTVHNLPAQIPLQSIQRPSLKYSKSTPSIQSPPQSIQTFSKCLKTCTMVLKTYSKCLDSRNLIKVPRDLLQGKVPVYKVWKGSVMLCKYCVVGFVVMSVCYCLGSDTHYQGPYNTIFT